MQQLVKELQANGTTIQAMGLESHFIVGETPSYNDLVSNMQAYADLGLVVSLNELDIRMDLPVTDAKLAQQKTDYETVISACMAVEACIAVTVWDFDDAVCANSLICATTAEKLRCDLP